MPDGHYNRNAGDLAEELKRPMFMAGMARELFALARAAGREEDDFSVVHETIRDLNIE